MSEGLCLGGVAVDLLGRRVLAPVHLDVDRGTWISLVGPNGAGKTTLLRAVAGGVPASGTIRFAGHDLARASSRQRARVVATVPQQPTRPEGMRVVDYVLLGRSPYVPYLGREGRTDLAVAEAQLERLDLVTFADRPVATLSGGEFQRVVLARALAQEAPLLLLDEPTSALDLGHAQQVLELVEQLRHERGLTVVAAMHDLTLASQYSDEVVLLADGEVVARGPAARVLTVASVRRHFDAEIHVFEDANGGAVVLPRRVGTGTWR